VEKLDDELYKALQLTTDVYGTEYSDILANSSKFLILLKRVMKFFMETQQVQPLAVVSLRLIEQLYYKPDVLNKAVFESIRSQVPEEEKNDWDWPDDSKKFMMQLCCNVVPKGKPIRQRIDPSEVGLDPSAYGQVRLNRRASLCQAYHLALHDHFQPARDLLHLGNMQELAMDSDVHTQILYNRVLAQTGLCAFRLGKIQDAHTFLMDVCMHNKARELLAQGLSYSKNMDRTPEQERAEKMRQLPYHMHINLEVLESAHRICAMLLEVPNLAMQAIDPNNKRIISRVLRRALEDYDKKVFTGPPEDAKEAVVYAAKALQRGDWQTAVESLEDLKLWDHIDSGDMQTGQKIKAMIRERIQTEALRTYLFAYASIYDAFHLDQLVGMFGLEAKLVHSIVSKLMIREEITAFWDESSKYVLMQHSEPTPLQRLALTLADKGAQAVENNERLVDQKSGGYGFAQRGAAGAQQPNFDGKGGGGKGRFGKGGAGGGQMDQKGKGKGRGKSMGSSRPVGNRGWDNARAGAIRGNAQRGWATGNSNTMERTM
jgi:translation initiation factor 3 subunit C